MDIAKSCKSYNFLWRYPWNVANYVIYVSLDQIFRNRPISPDIDIKEQPLLEYNSYSIGIICTWNVFFCRDIRKALEIDPIHDKTILRRAHCYEALDPAKSLMVCH